MIYVFSILVFLGVIHLVLLLNQKKRISKIDQNYHVALQTSALDSKIENIYLMNLISTIRDIKLNLLGKHKNDFIKNTLSIIALLAAGTYINLEYISFSQWIVVPLNVIFAIYVIYVRNKKKSQVEFETGFSEALNIISSTVRAGNSIFQGIEQCGKKVKGMVGDEFRTVSQRLEIGEEPKIVFMDSYKRMPFKEYYFFIVVALNNMKAGGQLKEVINRLSAVISNSRIMDRKKLAKTSEVRMSVKILAAIPAFFVIFLKYQSPENFDILVNHDIGKMLFYYAIASILFGLLIIWSMINKV